MSAGPAQSLRLEEATQALDGRPAMPVDEAKALIEGLDPSAEGDHAALVADRAEAAAELAAARLSLGLPEIPLRPAPATAPKAGPASGLQPLPPPPPPPPPFDPAPLREAAKALKRADHEVHSAEAALAALCSPPLPASDEADQEGVLALAEAEAAREQLAPARRRLAGALISGTGMAIVIAALGWQAWWYLVPTVLIAIITADLRVAGSAANEAAARAEQQLMSLGFAGQAHGNGVPGREQDLEAVTRRAQEAGRRYAEAEAHWADLAPGVDPADVESLVEREEEAARQASAPVAPIPEEGEGPEEGPEEREAADEPADLVSDLPDPGDDPVLALAVRLAQEAAHTLIETDRRLADLSRVEYARRSLEWHAARWQAG